MKETLLTEARNPFPIIEYIGSEGFLEVNPLLYSGPRWEEVPFKTVESEKQTRFLLRAF